MKKLILIPLLFGALFLGSPKIYAQSSPPSGHGGGAPIGGGLFILLGLGAAYGGAKGYKYLKSDKDEPME